MKSITKALSILDLILTNENVISLKDIAKALDLKYSTAYRILSVLVKRGYVEKTKQRGKYSIGVRLLDISVSKLNIPDKINTDIPYVLVQLSKLVKESVFFTVWYGSDILLSRSYEEYSSLETVRNDWRNQLLHQTCVGKIILANMSKEDLHSYFREVSLLDASHKVNISVNQMKKQIDIVRKTNLAFENDERLSGISGVASGVRNKDGEVIGAVFITGSSSRLTHKTLETISIGCQQCASKISNELGFTG